MCVTCVYENVFSMESMFFLIRLGWWETLGFLGYHVFTPDPNKQVQIRFCALWLRSREKWVSFSWSMDFFLDCWLFSQKNKDPSNLEWILKWARNQSVYLRSKVSMGFWSFLDGFFMWTEKGFLGGKLPWPLSARGASFWPPGCQASEPDVIHGSVTRQHLLQRGHGVFQLAPGAERKTTEPCSPSLEVMVFVYGKTMFFYREIIPKWP